MNQPKKRNIKKRKRGAAKPLFFPRSRVGLMWQNYWNGL
jgi:hypothetical protein